MSDLRINENYKWRKCACQGSQKCFHVHGQLELVQGKITVWGYPQPFHTILLSFVNLFLTYKNYLSFQWAHVTEQFPYEMTWNGDNRIFHRPMGLLWISFLATYKHSSEEFWQFSFTNLKPQKAELSVGKPHDNLVSTSTSLHEAINF